MKGVRRLIARRSSPFELALFGVAPLVLLGWLTWTVAGHGGGGVFGILHKAGQAVSEGRSPYPPPAVAVIARGGSYVYSEPFAYLFVPSTWIPYHVGTVVFLIVSVAAVALSIRLLGGRDWRLYGVAILTVPMYEALRLGAIGPVLLLLVAAGWRYRERAAGGVLLALAAAVKLFLWPVLLWLVFTRRWRGSAAAAATLAVVVGIWALTDWDGLTGYPTILRLLNQVFGKGSYSTQALVIALGASRAVAEAVVIVLAIAGVGVIWLLRRREDEAFSAAVVLSLVTTPLLWMHYLVLLFVPLVLVSPTLSVWWLVLVPLWATPYANSRGDLWRLLLTATVVTVIAVAPRFLLRRHSDEVAHASLAEVRVTSAP